ncbi:MAG: hypothetical protein LBU22_10665 [Dysgonamonadaceae bacterium]|nr:hypothetical protein [Dysgonamonadaceae bacterium]
MKHLSVGHTHRMEPPDGVWHTGEAGFYGYVFPTGNRAPSRFDVASSLKAGLRRTEKIVDDFISTKKNCPK